MLQYGDYGRYTSELKANRKGERTNRVSAAATCEYPYDMLYVKEI
jgi:hypothetical protein